MAIALLVVAGLSTLSTLATLSTLVTNAGVDKITGTAAAIFVVLNGLGIFLMVVAALKFGV